MKDLRLPVVTSVVAVLAAAGIAAGIAMTDDTRMGPGMMSPGSTSTPGWWDDSWDSMMGGQSGPASEREYLIEMVAHHEEAVAAGRELARSDRAELRALGTSIVQTQSAQIEQMTTWLADWYPDQPVEDEYKPMMRDLSGLSGDRLDRVFLEDMIGHHMVAVMMSQHLLWRGVDHEGVASLARSIRGDQHKEIVQMQRWLAEWFDIDWHPGLAGHMGYGRR